MKFLHNIKNKIKKKMEDENISKKDIWFFVLFISIIIFFTVFFVCISYLFNTSFNSVLYGFIFGFILVIFTVVMFLSGLIVLKSLFRVGAEISLLLFISQSYCSISDNLQTGMSTEAIKFLIISGLIFVASSFFKNIWKSFKELKGKISTEKNNKFECGSFLLMLAIMIAFFICLLILTLWPIIENLCFI